MSRPRHPQTIIRAACGTAFIILLLLAGANAQTTTLPREGVASTAADTKAADEESIRLSAFQVTERTGDGYAEIASTVSRVAIRNTEIPISALVINEKLISDTMAVGVEDTFNLISGLHHGNAGTGNQENNNFSLRGYGGTTAQRDGVDDSLFNSSGGFDYMFVERLEVVKGPNGILYGSHSPGGVINIISKRPLPVAFTKVSAMAGSFGFLRGEVDTSQFIDKQHRFSYRIAAAVTKVDGPINFPGDPKKGFRGINPSVMFRSKSGWDVWFWTAFIRDSSSRAKHVTPAFATSAPISATIPGPTGAPLIDRTVIAGGAGQNLIHSYSQVNTDSYELGTSRSFTFGPITLDARLLGRYRSQLNDGSRVRATSNNQYLDANGILLNTGSDNRFTPVQNVQGKIAYIYRQRFQYDSNPAYNTAHNYGLDLNFSYDTWKVHHQTLISATYGLNHDDIDNSNYVVQNLAGSTSVLDAFGYESVNGLTRVYTYPIARVKFDLNRETAIAKANALNLNRNLSDSETAGVGLMQRASFLDSRVILVAGGRLQKVESETGRWNFATQSVPSYTLAEKTSRKPGFAGLVKVYKGELGEAMAFANFNQTYTPVFSTDNRIATRGNKFPDRVAMANEYGVKFNLLRSRLVLTASIYDNKETNYLVTFIDSDGTITGVKDQGYQVPSGTRTNKGFDIDLNYQFGSLDVLISYGKVTPRLADGRFADAMPFDTAAALLTYRFRKGWSKGFTASYIYNHWGESSLNSRTYWIIPGGDRHSGVVGYRWHNTDIRLRVENLFDVRDPQPSSFDQSVGITNPRSVRFSITQNF